MYSALVLYFRIKKNEYTAKTIRVGIREKFIFIRKYFSRFKKIKNLFT